MFARLITWLQNGIYVVLKGITGLYGLLFDGNPARHLKGYEQSLLVLGFESTMRGHQQRASLKKSIRSIYALPSPCFDWNFVITGTTSGLGQGLAAHFLALGANVVMANRRDVTGLDNDIVKLAQQILKKYRLEEKSETTATELKERLFTLKLDLSDLESVFTFVNDLKTFQNGKFAKVDVLINNAGNHDASTRRSKQGFELNVAVNFVGAAVLTKAMLEQKVITSDPGSAQPRIVSVSSQDQKFAFPLDTSVDLMSQPLYKTLSISSAFHRYAASKLLMTGYFTSLVQRNQDIVVYDVCPGAIATNIAANAVSETKLKAIGGFVNSFMIAAGESPEEGALPYVMLVVDSQDKYKGPGFNGKHYAKTFLDPVREDLNDLKVIEWIYEQVDSIYNSFSQ